MFCCGKRHDYPDGYVIEEASTLHPAVPRSDVIKFPCRFRSEEPDSERKCTTCKGNVRIKIYECRQFGHCTLTEPIGFATCQQCGSYQRRPESGFQWVTTADLARETIRLASILPKDLCGVAGIPRSGMIPAALLATHLHAPLFSLEYNGLKPLSCGWRLSDSNDMRRPGPMLVIDDTSMYGGAQRAARDWWSKHGMKDRDVIFGVIYTSPPSLHMHGPMPQIWAIELDEPHLLEWCLFNCGYVLRTAFDLDGIMTVDGTILPQYLPRKFTIPLIVTGRFESERVPTEKWLSDHGVKYHRLVMFPGNWTPENLAVRDQPGAIAEYKAKHFKDSGLAFFCESDPVQAQAIFDLVQKPVICPTVSKVFS
jgi:orotate phosphoribosyltransferase